MLLNSTVECLSDGKGLIKVTGPLTLGTSLSFLEAQIQKAIDNGISELTMDISGVNYSDSAGLGLLVHTYGLLNSKQGKMRLSGVQPRVLQLLKMTKIDSLLPIEEGVQEV